jgi:hypothetical protein
MHLYNIHSTISNILIHCCGEQNPVVEGEGQSTYHHQQTISSTLSSLLW